MTRNRMLPGFTGCVSISFLDHEPRPLSGHGPAAQPEGRTVSDAPGPPPRSPTAPGRRSCSARSTSTVAPARGGRVDRADRYARFYLCAAWRCQRARRCSAAAATPPTAMGLIEQGRRAPHRGQCRRRALALSRQPGGPGCRSARVTSRPAGTSWPSAQRGRRLPPPRDALTPLTHSAEGGLRMLLSLAKGVEPGAVARQVPRRTCWAAVANVAPDASASLARLVTDAQRRAHLLRRAEVNLREILEVCVDAGLQTDQIIASGRGHQGAAAPAAAGRRARPRGRPARDRRTAQGGASARPSPPASARASRRPPRGARRRPGRAGRLTPTPSRSGALRHGVRAARPAARRARRGLLARGRRRRRRRGGGSRAARRPGTADA